MAWHGKGEKSPWPDWSQVNESTPFCQYVDGILDMRDMMASSCCRIVQN